MILYQRTMRVSFKMSERKENTITSKYFQQFFFYFTHHSRYDFVHTEQYVVLIFKMMSCDVINVKRG